MAPAAARAELESLLRARKLDRTLTVTHPLPIAPPAERLVTTGVPALDAALGGGVPRGQISELVGVVSSGRTAVLHRLLAQATGQGELAAVVDVGDAFDPAAAAAQGVRLDQLLWVRGEAESAVSRAHQGAQPGGVGRGLRAGGLRRRRRARARAAATALYHLAARAARARRQRHGLRAAGRRAAGAQHRRRIGAPGRPSALRDRRPARPCRTFTRRCEPTGSSGPVPTRAGSRACRQAPTCSTRCAARRACSRPQSHRGIWPQSHRAHRRLPQRHRAHRDFLRDQKAGNQQNLLL